MHTYTHNLICMIAHIVHPDGSIYWYLVLIANTVGHTLTLGLSFLLLCPTHSHKSIVLHMPCVHGEDSTQVSTSTPTHTDTHAHTFIELLWACANGSVCTHIFEHIPRLSHTHTSRQWPGVVNHTGQSLAWWPVPTTVTPTEHQVPCTLGSYLIQSSWQLHEVLLLAPFYRWWSWDSEP